MGERIPFKRLGFDGVVWQGVGGGWGFTIYAWSVLGEIEMATVLPSQVHAEAMANQICSAIARPTIRTMSGETHSTYGLEKSPWECWTPRPGWAVRAGPPEHETCTAPTPRAP